MFIQLFCLADNISHSTQPFFWEVLQVAVHMKHGDSKILTLPHSLIENITFILNFCTNIYVSWVVVRG